MKPIYFSIFATLLSVSSILAQTKDEREERIELKDLPQTVVTVINTLPQTVKRLKFYKETDGEHQSFEAKFKYNHKHYSIEFDTIGKIEDIEVVLKKRQFINGVKNKIALYFTNTFKKAKLIKIQKQFVYTNTVSADVFIKNVLNETIETTINYEIIAEVTEISKRNIREFTFNQKGDFVSFRTLAQPYYSHILYEN